MAVVFAWLTRTWLWLWLQVQWEQSVRELAAPLVEKLEDLGCGCVGDVAGVDLIKAGVQLCPPFTCRVHGLLTVVPPLAMLWFACVPRHRAGVGFVASAYSQSHTGCQPPRETARDQEAVVSETQRQARPSEAAADCIQ